MNKRRFLEFSVFALCNNISSTLAINSSIELKQRRVFCIDFNWSNQAIARPEDFCNSDPYVHYKFYESINANVVQTFSVALNGHSFYRGNVAPVVKNLKYDFLPEIAEICHTNGKLCFGYFCWGSNLHYSKSIAVVKNVRFNPEDVYLNPSALYTNYFLSLLQDSFVKVKYDGYLLDWFSLPDIEYRNDNLLKYDFKLMSEIFCKILKLNASYNKFMIVNSVDNELNNLLWKFILDDPNVLQYRSKFAILNESGLKKRHEFLSKNYIVAQNLSGWKGMNPLELSKIKSDIYYGYLAADPVTTLPFDADIKTILKIKSVYLKLNKLVN